MIGHIPSELAALKKMEIFVLDINNLVGKIPPWLGSFSSLVELWLGFNKLSGEKISLFQYHIQFIF